MKKNEISIELIIQDLLIIVIIVYQFLVIVFTFNSETTVTPPLRYEIFYQNEIATSNLNDSIKKISIAKNFKIQNRGESRI